MRAERGRLTLALLLSLLIHTLLLSLTFGSEGHGLPGFDFPWRKRRIEAPDLRVVLMPAKVTAAEPAGAPFKEPLPPASIEQTVVGGPAPASTVPTATFLNRTAETIVPKADATAQAEPKAEIVPAPVPAKAPLPTEVSGDTVPTPVPVPEVIAVERSSEPTFAVPPASQVPTPVIAVAPSAPIPETVVPERVVEVAKPDPAEREAQARRQAEQLESVRIEAARLEAVRQEAARVEAARLEAARLEAARLEAQRKEAERVAAAQQEAQRQEVARQEPAQREAQRKEAARLEDARLETQRQEAARLETDRQEAVRQAAAQKEAARVLAEKEEDARRDARRQAMGRQLNEEAARREAASTLPYSLSSARRGRLWGRSDPNVELVQYAEAWARKIQFNTSVDTVREVAKRPHTNPMVSVAIRSDGSVESVTFVLSSGVAEVDEAIRRIVQSQVYPAFPPGLAREFDVIEVRRTWHFDTAVRLY